MTRWLECPDRAHHETDDRLAPVLAHGYDETRAAHTATALIGEGHCPACPRERLDVTELPIAARDRHAGICPCCGAAWQHDGTEYVLVRRGRLIDT